MPSTHVTAMQVVLVCLIMEEATSGGNGDHNNTMTFLALMLAMPWARWYNGDNTFLQVVAGVWFGTVVGEGGWALQKWFYSNGKTVAIF